MTVSASIIDQQQLRWASGRSPDPKHTSYLLNRDANLFLGHLHPDTEQEFGLGDGSELEDTKRRPAKMRALSSSAALAVNFFDAWRDKDKAALAKALDLPATITELTFEFKTRDYPVRPRSPNLDLMLGLSDGRHVAVESKFSEPYRSEKGFSFLSAKYFRGDVALWRTAGLARVQRVADTFRPDAHAFRPEWMQLDVRQLVKHLLGLATDRLKPSTLIYLWFDTGKADADGLRGELKEFSRAIAGEPITFVAQTYQAVFGAMSQAVEPVPGWYSYMEKRYFGHPI